VPFLVAGLLGVGLLASPAAAAQKLIMFPVSIRANVDVTMTSHWKGISTGCLAPAENIDMRYHITMRTHPAGTRSARQVTKAMATLLDSRPFSAPERVQGGRAPRRTLELPST